MRICYIGRTCHRETALKELLEGLLDGAADRLERHEAAPDASSSDGFDIAALADGGFDLVCVFELDRLARRIAEAGIGTRLVVVPMHDGGHGLDPDDWTVFADRPDIRVISLSSALHRVLSGLSVASYRFRYFPDPAAVAGYGMEDGDRREVFHTSRGGPPSREEMAVLLGPDAARPVDAPARDGEARMDSDTPPPFHEVPSFLDAMAAGRCVIAADAPVANEYIVHGVTGLLYDPGAPAPLDLSSSARIGDRAAHFMRDGHRAWHLDAGTRLKDVLFSDHAPPSIWGEAGSYIRHLGPEGIPQAFAPLGDSHARMPTVSVAMVCYDAVDAVSATLDSILAQTYGNMNVIVVDGGSTDGTVDLLEARKDRFSAYLSEPDGGTYEAMNKAIRLSRSDYILFMNAGDFFERPTALEEAMTSVFGREGVRSGKDLPEFVIGHHVYAATDGATALHMAQPFEVTWNQLQDGTLPPRWWNGIPCHQSTLTLRYLLLDRGGYDPRFAIAADHDAMFTARARGARFAHCARIVATYTGGGFSQDRSEECIQESYRIVSSVAPDTPAVRDFYIRSFGLLSVVEDSALIRDRAATIRESGLFCEDWYRLKYMTREFGKSDPVLHYLVEGCRKDHTPNPLFDAEHYRRQVPDAADPSSDPFMHYIAHGRTGHGSAYDWDDPDAALGGFAAILSPDDDIGAFVTRLAEADDATLSGLFEEARKAEMKAP